MAKALDLVLAAPWCIRPDALEQIIAIADRAAGETIEQVEARLGRPLDNSQTVEIRDGGVAVIPVRGPLFRYANLFTQISGATSTEILARDFTTAVDDPAVRRIVLDIDSPGGEANGIAELAGMIRAADKSVTAYIDGVGASAAYWLAAAADRVVCSATALIGSIGTVATYRAEKNGPIRIISTQSPLKQATPDTERGRIEAQRIVDELTAVFIGAVAGYRNTTPETVAADFGRGGILVGAAAVGAGMADSLGSFESVIAGETGQSQETFRMSEKTQKGLEVTAAWLQANHPDVDRAIRAEAAAQAIEAGAAALRAEGAETERARIQGVRAQLIPGHDALIEQLAFDGATTAEQAAIQVLAAERSLRDAQQQRIKQAVPPVAGAEAPSPLPVATFESVVDGHVADGLTRGQAMARAAKDNPELHKAWLGRINPATAA